MKCKNCESEIAEEMVFCAECGEKVEAEEISEAIGEKEQVKGCRGKKIVISAISILAVCIAFFAVWYMVIIPNNNYKNAMELMNAGNYEEAISVLEILGEYKDCQEQILECRYQQALKIIEDDNIEVAYEKLTELGNYKDSKQLLENFKWVVSKKVTIDRMGDEYTTNYSYNTQGNCTRELTTRPDGSKDITDYSYNEQGECIKKVDTLFYGNTNTTEYTYDEQGNCIKKVHDYEYDKEVTDYIYDEQGWCIKEVYSSEHVSHAIDYSYNEQGKIIQKVYTGDSYGNQSKTDYFYDEQGKCIKDVEVYFSGTTYITSYSYDDQGRCIKKVVDPSDGSYKSTTEWSYDEQGNCIEEKHTAFSSDVTTSEYEYQFIYAAKNKENKSVEKQPNEGNEEEVVDETLISSDSEDLEIKYRVRKAADDAESQIGAFAILDNAKQEAIKHKDEGYKVYDMDGSLIYEP